MHAVAAQMTEEEDVVRAVDEHRERWGRMDVLVNNAGVGLGGAIEGYPTKKIDMQLDLNLRAIVISTRESLGMLREAGGEHGKALIVNTASVAGKAGQGWLSIYSATKAGVIGFSQATQSELGRCGDSGDGSLPGLRGYADDGFREGPGGGGGDDPPGGHRGDRCGFFCARRARAWFPRSCSCARATARRWGLEEALPARA